MCGSLSWARRKGLAMPSPSISNLSALPGAPLSCGASPLPDWPGDHSPRPSAALSRRSRAAAQSKPTTPQPASEQPQDERGRSATLNELGPEPRAHAEKLAAGSSIQLSPLFRLLWKHFERDRDGLVGR